MKIGLIGLGQMGYPMAKHLQSEGIDLIVTSRSEIKRKKLKKEGFAVVNSNLELTEICDILITIVPSDTEVEEIFLGEKTGILNNDSKIKTYLEMSSIQGQTMKVLQEYAGNKGLDVHFIDAPVSGGVAAAGTGDLTIMASGAEHVFNEIKWLLEVLGQKIFYTGALGSGSDIKMLNQLLNATHTIIAAEAIALAESLNIDINMLFQVINESSGSSWVTKNNVLKNIIPGNHEPGFTLQLMKKDIDLTLTSMRKQKLFAPISNLVEQLYSATINDLDSQKNYTIIAEWIRQGQPKQKEVKE